MEPKKKITHSSGIVVFPPVLCTLEYSLQAIKYGQSETKSLSCGRGVFSPAITGAYAATFGVRGWGVGGGGGLEHK